MQKVITPAIVGEFMVRRHNHDSETGNIVYEENTVIDLLRLLDCPLPDFNEANQLLDEALKSQYEERKRKLTSYDAVEIADRLKLISENLSTYVSNHPFMYQNLALQKIVEDCIEKLGEVYQKVLDISFTEEPLTNETES